MRVLFLVSDTGWSARARAFVLAARGLAARGIEPIVACETDCPLHVRAAEHDVQVLTLEQNASAAGDAWQLRREVQEREVDVIFVHTDDELLVAGSAVRLGGRRSAAVVRRVPPFAIASQGRGARIAMRPAHTGLLFSTEADSQAAAAKEHRGPSAVATLGIDVEAQDAVREVARSSFGVPQNSRFIVCVYDGSDKRRVLTPLRTLALLAPRHPELHLAIIGAGDDAELRMHGAALGVSAMVSFFGARDDELSILRTADVGWVAARDDAGAFACLDFMSFRVPVVAERDALTEHYVADGIAGLLLAPADPTTTAASVAAFLAKDPQRAQMGNAGRARLQREFSVNAMVDGFEQIVRQVAERAATAAR